VWNDWSKHDVNVQIVRRSLKSYRLTLFTRHKPASVSSKGALQLTWLNASFIRRSSGFDPTAVRVESVVAKMA
jgi:hypothetical protein